MKIADIHERLRLKILDRIRPDTFSISDLARQTGLDQSHLSNFLNEKREISRRAMDLIMSALDIGVEHLLPELHRHNLDPDRQRVSVPIVSHQDALSKSTLFERDVKAYLPLPPETLQRLGRRNAGRRQAWQRFVAVHVSSADAGPMEPLILPGALVVIDRHHNTIKPYRPLGQSLFAVRSGTHLVVRYAEFFAGQIALRTYRPQDALEILETDADRMLHDCIAGRIVYILNPL